jgi:hypothetical protein
LPLVFEPNRGQTDPEVKFLARAGGYTLFLTDREAVLSGRDGYPVRMRLAGSRKPRQVEGLEPTGGISNYLHGKNAEESHTNIPNYARLSVAGVYDGIDLVFYAHGGDLEYDFVVAPGADPKKIRLAFGGIEKMRVDDQSGDLVLTATGGSELRQVRPKVYKKIGERSLEIAGAYVMRGRRRAALRCAMIGGVRWDRPYRLHQVSGRK